MENASEMLRVKAARVCTTMNQLRGGFLTLFATQPLHRTEVRRNFLHAVFFHAQPLFDFNAVSTRICLPICLRQLMFCSSNKSSVGQKQRWTHMQMM